MGGDSPGWTVRLAIALGIAILASATSAHADPANAVSPSAEVEARARECTMQGDNACVIRLLEAGRARTPGALSMLIEAYRARGQTNMELRHMREFLRRYPAHLRAPWYLRRQGDFPHRPERYRPRPR